VKSFGGNKIGNLIYDFLRILHLELEHVHVLHYLSSLYRPDDDPDKGRNIVVKDNIYLYLVKGC
jgi:hypothetical protein